MIEKHDPILILKEDTAKYNAYSRTCSSDTRRQPVILTDQQLDKIKKENPGFLREEDIIKYGSDQKNKYNYICPRYWCLKNNTVINPKDLKEITVNGKKELIHPTCGKVLSKQDKVVKPGYYIYDFYHSKKDDYKRYPGFQVDKHPDGYCLPCCFDKYNTQGRIKAKEKCYNETPEEIKKQENEVKTVGPEEDYVKGPEKFPLDPGRWGYMPTPIQIFLQESAGDCQISKTNTNLKSNHTCLLRHGIQLSDNQSFIACISDLLFFGTKNTDGQQAKILSIKEMRERIKKAISIDKFITYQNGSLVNEFEDISDLNSIKIDNYKDTKLFSKVNKENKEELIYLKKVISAYENFMKYLSDENAIINHTYLWDIVSTPNKYLFPNGLNLFILKIPNDDITNNVSIICPTNHYSSQFYQARKPSVFIIKEEEYYEPIYAYKSTDKKVIISKEFKEMDPHLSPSIRNIIQQVIKPIVNSMCRPLDSMPFIYKAKRGILLQDLIENLTKLKYNIKKLVLNFNNKIIGVVTEDRLSTSFGFVPCFPSFLSEAYEDLDTVFMNDSTIWQTYANTVNFLLKLISYESSRKFKTPVKIPCRPVFKMVEDNMVVGILTETNQFIQLSQPILETDIPSIIDLPSIKNENYIVNKDKLPLQSSNSIITTSQKIDDERVNYIKKITLESNFLNIFRNTIRILLNDYDNLSERNNLLSILNNNFIIYSKKLKIIIDSLKNLVNENIKFIGDEKFYQLIENVTTCINKTKEKCSQFSNLCAVSGDDCELILPEKNLLSGKLNEPIYYGRIADELIRYTRIKNFMFEPQKYLSFNKTGYNLTENEIIIIQSMLTQEYFESLIPTIKNKYIENTSYDNVEPILTQTYDNKINNLSDIKENDISCDTSIKLNNTSSSFWAKCFPKKFKEKIYKSSINCTFNTVIDIIYQFNNIQLSVNKIKNDLYEEYLKFIEERESKVLDILIIEGKKNLGEQVKVNNLSFMDFIFNENYYLTPLDMWILLKKYNVPCIFLSSTEFIQSQSNFFIGNGKSSDFFVFIKFPSLKVNDAPQIKIMMDEENRFFINLSDLKNECRTLLDDHMNSFNLNNFINYFSKKKSKKILIIEEDISNKSSDNNDPKKQKLKKYKKIKNDEIIIDEVINDNKTKKKKINLKGRTKKRILKIED